MTTTSRDLGISLTRRWGTAAGTDGVGRGVLIDLVVTSVAFIGIDVAPAPEGLTDSKVLTTRRHEVLVDPVRE